MVSRKNIILLKQFIPFFIGTESSCGSVDTLEKYSSAFTFSLLSSSNITKWGTSEPQGHLAYLCPYSKVSELWVLVTMNNCIILCVCTFMSDCTESTQHWSKNPRKTKDSNMQPSCLIFAHA